MCLTPYNIVMDDHGLISVLVLVEIVALMLVEVVAGSWMMPASGEFFIGYLYRQFPLQFSIISML